MSISHSPFLYVLSRTTAANWKELGMPCAFLPTEPLQLASDKFQITKGTNML